MRGGYQIVDLKQANLSDSEVSVPGVHEAIEGNYHKPVLLSGINIGGVERADVFTSFDSSSGNYVAAIYGGTLTITSDDAITFVK